MSCVIKETTMLPMNNNATHFDFLNEVNPDLNVAPKRKTIEFLKNYSRALDNQSFKKLRFEHPVIKN